MDEQAMAPPMKSGGDEKPPHTAHGEAQRAALVRAAYDLIAEKGLEGLRTRNVAKKAGVNVATLHYYFASKEDLIRGVVNYMREQFRFKHAPPPPPTPSKPLEYVRQEFADVGYQIHTISENYIVLFEIFLRSLRCFEEQITAGVRQGVFRPDLDVSATAAALIAFIEGAVVQLLFNSRQFPAERVYTQVERWLTDSVIH